MGSESALPILSIGKLKLFFLYLIRQIYDICVRKMKINQSVNIYAEHANIKRLGEGEGGSGRKYKIIPFRPLHCCFHLALYPL